MYACLCRAVTDRSVRETVAAGASTVSQVRATCGAGTGCGGCLPSLRRLLKECLGVSPAERGHAGNGLACTGVTVLDGGRGLNLESTCSANCAEAMGPAGEPMCVAGLGVPAAEGRGEDAPATGTLEFA